MSSIRPAGAGAKNPHGRKQHREIAKYVIARANPDRAHVRVPSAEAGEHERHAAIGDQRSKTHHAHDFGARQSAMECVPCSAPRHPKRE